MNKKQLSERDICTKFITPSLRQAVDELMVVCDQLEAHLKTVDDVGRRALEAVLRDALADAGAPGAVMEHESLA